MADKGGAAPAVDMSKAPIDRGYAWLIVVGCFIMNFVTIGAYKSLGILFVEFLEEFRSSTASTAWMAAVMGMLFSLGAPVAASLSQRFGHRKVIIVGGILSTLSPILTSFATNIVYIIFSYGLLMGAGVGLAYGPSIIMVAMYFEKRRALANGIAVAGSSVGQFILPPLLRILLDNFTYQGAMLVLGGLMMNIILAGALMRPLSYYARPLKAKSRKEIMEDDTNKSSRAKESQNNPVEIQIEAATPLATPIDETVNCDDFSKIQLVRRSSSGSRSESPKLAAKDSAASENKHETFLYASNLSLADASLQQISDRQSNVEDGADVNVARSRLSWLCTCSTDIDDTNPPLFECSLFRNPLFIVFVISALLGNFFYANQFLFIPPYCNDIGMSKDNQALLMAIMGAADLVGRIFCGWVADLGIVKRSHIMSASMIFTGTAGLFVPLITTFEGMAVYISFVGMFGGTFVALLAVVLVDFLGVEKLSSGFGLTLMLFGSSSMVGPPFLGWLRDITKSYHSSFRLCGASILLGGIVILFEPLVRRYFKKESPPDDNGKEDNQPEETNETLIDDPANRA